jgi:mannose-6-phosphate isomerase-like protein (cupin superfamily)
VVDYTAVRVSDVEGPFGGAMHRVRASLGVSSMGIQVIDMPPNFTAYPEHDHSRDGQEEVYIALRGSGVIEIAGDSVPLDDDTVVRVGAGTPRKIVPGDQGLRVLALGGCPGRPYEAPAWSEHGGPEPGPPAA